MEVTKSQKRLFILLGLVVLYAAYDFISNKEDYDLMYGGGKGTKQVKATKNVQLKATQQTKQITDLDMEFRRDPFFRDDMIKKIVRYKKRFKPQAKPLKLQAITYAQDNSIVMINDLILSEGEYVDGYVVDKIEKTRVKLTKNGKSIYLNSK